MKLYIGDNLKHLRAQKKITQAQLADVLNVSYQAVSRWENNSAYPDIELLPELARFFGVSLEEILGCRNNEKAAQQQASDLHERIFFATMNNDPDTREHLLNELRELEQQYPNNLHIKSRITESLLFPTPESYDKILPEIRRYANAALDAFPTDKAQHAYYFIRSMAIAAPEEEAEEWADKLPFCNWDLRWNGMKIRYQEREEWEKARYYESMGNLLHLRDLATCGPIPETEENPKGKLYAVRHAERIYDAAIGIPYVDESGKVHNSLCLLERIDLLLTAVLVNLGSEYHLGTEEETAEGIGDLKKVVDYSLLYADAVKEECFTSDNPYFIPQKVGNHLFMDVKEQNHLRERSLDQTIEFLTHQNFDRIREDEQFREQWERLTRKKAEIEEYWRLRNGADE